MAKKSKILASMLCATVVAGLYAAPAMAQINVDDFMKTKNGQVIIHNGSLENIKLGMKYTALYGANGNGIRMNGDGVFLQSNGLNIAHVTTDGLSLSQGDITLTTADGVISVKDLNSDVAELNKKTEGIVRKGGTTTIEGTTKFDGNGMQVGNRVSINKDGSIVSNSGDATFRFDKDNIALSNGTNNIFVGNNSVTLDAAGTALKMTKTGLDYAKGAFTVGADGALSAANGAFSVDAHGGIHAGDGAFTVRSDGSVFANGAVKADDFVTKDGIKLSDVNSKINNMGANVAGITREHETTTIEGATSFDRTGMMIESMNGMTNMVGGQATFKNVNGTTNINGGTVRVSKDVIVSNGDENISLVGVNEQLKDVQKVNANVAGIKRKGETTIIEGTTKFDANGMQVGNRVSINKDGSIVSNSGDATFRFEKDNIALSNGTNNIFVGNNSVTLDVAGTALQMTKTGLDYAKGAFTVGADGALSAANGAFSVDARGGISVGDGAFTVRSDGSVWANGAIKADDFITKDGVKLSDVNDRLNDLEKATGEANANVAGIKREGETTIIEGATSFDKSGMMIESMNGMTNMVGGQATFQNVNGFTNINGGQIITGKLTVGGVDFKGFYDDVNNRLGALEDKTQNIDSGSTHGPSEPGSGEGPVDNGAHTGVNGDVTVGGNITAGSGNIGGVEMSGGNITAGQGTFDKVTVGKTEVTDGKVTVGKTEVTDGKVTVGGEGKENVAIGGGDVVVTDKDGNQHSISGNAQAIEGIQNQMGSMNNRIAKVEDKIDKVGAMSAAIANLRTMGYDPTAPTEIAVGVGQYRSETGVALGFFHYPNKNFMLSMSLSTSGDEVMGGIGATWRFGTKSPEKMLQEEQEKAAKAKVEKAMAMKEAAKK